MKILDEKYYQQQYNLALAYSLNNEDPQKVLDILLDLKKQRYIRYELFELILKQYLLLTDQYWASQMIQTMKRYYPEKYELTLNTLREIRIAQIKQEEEGIIPINIIKTIWKSNDIFNQRITYGWCQMNYQEVLYDIEYRLKELQNLRIVQIFKIFCLIFTHQYSKLSQMIIQFQPLLDEITYFCQMMMKKYKIAKDFKNSSVQEIVQNLFVNRKFIIIEQPYYICIFDVVLLFKYNYIFEIADFKNIATYGIIQMLNSPLRYCLQSAANSYKIHLDILTNEPLIEVERQIVGFCQVNPNVCYGFCHLYQLYKRENKFQNLQELAKIIETKLDSTEKYKTLGLIHKDLQNFEFSISNLLIAQEFDIYDEEILFELYYVHNKINKFQEARSYLEKAITLENYNYYFVLKTITPFIQQYQYDYALELLNLTDKDNTFIYQIKICIQILSLPYINIQMLFEEIDRLQFNHKFYWHAIYFFKRKLIEQLSDAIIQYQDEYENEIQNIENIVDMDAIEKYEILQRLSDQNLLNNNQLTIHNILQGTLFSEHSNQHYNKCKRYCDSFDFFLSIILFKKQPNELFQYFQNECNLIVPQISKWQFIKYSIFYQIQQFYNIQKFPLKKYQEYITNAINKFEIQFNNYETLRKELLEYLNSNQTIVLEFISTNYQDEILMEPTIFEMISEIPFLFDPYSRIALKQIIQLFGLFVNLFVDDDFKNPKDWIEWWICNPLPSRYYNSLIEFKLNQH